MMNGIECRADEKIWREWPAVKACHHLALFILVPCIGIMLIVWIVGMLFLVGLYSLWKKYAKLELMIKEENFDILKSDKK